jgi:hypothetical protein
MMQQQSAKTHEEEDNKDINSSTLLCLHTITITTQY